MSDWNEKEEEDWKLIHILQMPEVDNFGFCKEKCSDPVCHYGCLRQTAEIFRNRIMEGIRLAREQGSDKYPLYADYVTYGIYGMTWNMPECSKKCKDAVCRVSGCMDKPAWHFRPLIRLVLVNKGLL